ncbi:HAD hydrolase-like protein [Candidatus Roizmanbacteria bacterium]|nr:HAD hydrolase-like protein [Candidatus Roizmanbacteria bacterium]
MEYFKNNDHKIKVIFDLLGVITVEGFFATKIVYPLIQNKISYDLFKKKYLMYSVGIITEDEFWDYIATADQIDFIEKQILDKTEITPKIQEVFHKLSKRDCDIYLATEIPRKWGELILEKAKLQNYFQGKFYSSDLKTTKPFKNFYDNIFNSISTKKSVVYCIDDTPINLTVAALYGATTIYLTNTEVVNNNAHYEITNIYNLVKIICKK